MIYGRTVKTDITTNKVKTYRQTVIQLQTSRLINISQTHTATKQELGLEVCESILKGKPTSDIQEICTKIVREKIMPQENTPLLCKIVPRAPLTIRPLDMLRPINCTPFKS